MIREAITKNALAFIACFSSQSVSREKTYQYDELLLAVEQLRQRRPNIPWLIPVRFDACKIPDYDIGGGRTLALIQRVDLFGDNREAGIARLLAVILNVLRQHLASIREITRKIKLKICRTFTARYLQRETWDASLERPLNRRSRRQHLKKRHLMVSAIKDP